ncbi:MAG: S8 family serine peptidase [Actinomycetaceae bacterium]|nr:S8 family serine peptidase [Actinomycetaceae bacterium]
MAIRRLGACAVLLAWVLALGWASPLIVYADEAEQVECVRGVTHYVDAEPQVNELLGIARAHTLVDGTGVIVAIVDSGVDATNAHLAGHVLEGRDFVSDGNGQEDNDGHGTAIAGQIVAQPIAQSRLSGVAPGAHILPVRVYNTVQTEGGRPAPDGPSIARTAAGIRWAAENGAHVIVVAQSVAEDDGSLNAAVKYADSRGALVVASAGNRQTLEKGEPTEGARYPAAYPTVLSVTAVDNAGLPTDAAVHGAHVEIAAPGQNVLTTWFADGNCILSPQFPSTSFSTGYVGGIAALVAQAHPHESPQMWKWRLESTALRAAPSQQSPLVGWGIVAPYDAIATEVTPRMPGPPLPGAEQPAEAATVGRIPPEVSEDPLAIRRNYAAIVTPAALFIIGVVWTISHGRGRLGEKRAGLARKA